MMIGTKTPVILSRQEANRLRELQDLINEAISVGEVQTYQREMNLIISRGAARALEAGAVHAG